MSHPGTFTMDLIFELKWWIRFLGFDVTDAAVDSVFMLNVWLLRMSVYWNRAHYSLEHVNEVTGYCELPGGLWVPCDQVCIRTFSNSPFSIIKVGDFYCVSTGDSYKPVFIHFSAVLVKIKPQIVSYFCDRCTSHPWMKKLKVSTTHRFLSEALTTPFPI